MFRVARQACVRADSKKAWVKGAFCVAMFDVMKLKSPCTRQSTQTSGRAPKHLSLGFYTNAHERPASVGAPPADSIITATKGAVRFMKPKSGLQI